MNITELITQLRHIRERHGDFEVRVTNDGYAPPEIAIYARPEQEGVLLYGKARPELINPIQGPDIELIND